VDAPGSVAELLDRMDSLLAPFEERSDPTRHFLTTYRRSTETIGRHIEERRFVDPDWVERWDLHVAGLYVDALERWDRAGEAPGPWAVAFRAASDEMAGGQRLPPLRHVLLGMNAHVNWDLPPSLLAVITDDELGDDEVMARHAEDHARLDAILVSRVDAEDEELKKVEGPGDRTWLDRALTPFNQAGTKRFLSEARRKCWRNLGILAAARRQGPDALKAKRDELERLSELRVADLKVPGQVLLKLAVKGFGVELSDDRRPGRAGRRSGAG